MIQWDTVGQEVYRSTTTSYFRNRHVILFCFDLSASGSLSSVESWLNEVKQTQPNSSALKVLVGCKSDMSSKHPTAEIDGFLKKNEIQNYYSCSALSGDGISEIFVDSIKKLIENKLLVDISPIKDLGGILRASSAAQKQQMAQQINQQQTPSGQPVGVSAAPQQMQQQTEQTVDISKQKDADDDEAESCC
ncbi:rab6, putative [Entamoeba invadens IP1]|uniref:Rab6, putative n=1 Tax=Entamoeba invadens IP1 TaxID=370355 RepID=A0A0A1TUK1_ENTIV|nr:rab6, putative [Entamoeba invadens IP1]ELP83714.1 rab6, putative [Entamoeba invadens IP1]|eukprot:XP_004183060.1 rab6, putative [Entamoeba invadens IP1]